MDKELRCRDCAFFDDSLTKDRYPLCLKRKRRGQMKHKHIIAQGWMKICSEFNNKHGLTI